jgi:hypothetical protein
LPTSTNPAHGILACHGTPIDDNQYLIEEPAVLDVIGTDLGHQLGLQRDEAVRMGVALPQR